jgi:hypothetical protein
LRACSRNRAKVPIKKPVQQPELSDSRCWRRQLDAQQYVWRAASNDVNVNAAVVIIIASTADDAVQWNAFAAWWRIFPFSVVIYASELSAVTAAAAQYASAAKWRQLRDAVLFDVFLTATATTTTTAVPIEFSECSLKQRTAFVWFFE